MKKFFGIVILTMLSIIIAIIQNVILGTIFRQDSLVLNSLLFIIYIFLPYFISIYLRKYLAKRYIIIGVQFILYILWYIISFIKVPEYFPKIVNENNGAAILLLLVNLLNLMTSFVFFVLGAIEIKKKQ